MGEDAELDAGTDAGVDIGRDTGSCGGSAFPCGEGEAGCISDTDCAPGLVCVPRAGDTSGMEPSEKVCLREHCRSGIADGDEAGVDCGGSCGVACPGPALGEPGYCNPPATSCGHGEGGCAENTDCEQGLSCVDNRGEAFGFAPSLSVCVPEECENGVDDGNEEGVDCGEVCGVECPAKPSDQFLGWPGTPNGRFGSIIARDGERIIIGAPDDAGTGRAYIYILQAGKWSLEAILSPNGQPRSNRSLDFGLSVALDGERALVGAPGADVAYVFEYVAGTWRESALLETVHQSRVGAAVGLHGATAVVGASPLSDRPGFVEIFNFDTGTWTSV